MHSPNHVLLDAFQACGDEYARHPGLAHCQECAAACRRREQACSQGVAS